MLFTLISKIDWAILDSIVVDMPPKRVSAQRAEETSTEQMANALLYEWWYSIAEVLFERVCEVTELDNEQKEALRTVALRPNDFHVELDGQTDTE